MCDLYVCGAPCPPWSAAGRKNGLGDSRSHILFHCLKYICITRPRTIVIENVKGITSRNFSHVLNFIEKLLKNCKYNFHHTVLDTKQHGIPQSRPRWYLVGIHHTCDEKTFEWPEEIERPSLDQFLDAEVQSPDVSLTAMTPRNQKILKDLMRKNFKGLELSEACPVLDIQASKKFMSWMFGCSPCITRARGGAKGYFLARRNRMMSVKEIASLQGWPGDYVDVMKRVRLTGWWDKV